MPIVAEYTAASRDLPLGPTLRRLPDVAIDVERQFATDPERPIGFFWATYDDFDAFEETLRDDPTVERFERFGDRRKRALYRIRQSGSGTLDSYRRWVALGAQPLSRRGTEGRWTVRMRFPDRAAFGSYLEYLVDAGVDVHVRRLSEEFVDTIDDGPLTDPQREALRLAYERGFYEIPRRTTLGDLASELGVSDQAVSERLRRAQARLIDEYVP